MYIDSTATYNAWRPLSFSYRTTALLVVAIDLWYYVKDVMHLPLLCRDRKQVQLDTLALRRGCLLYDKLYGKGMWNYT